MPLCNPPDEDGGTWKVAVDTVILVADGIVPVALTATEPKRLAPVPDAKLLVQFAMSAKFSV